MTLNIERAVAEMRQMTAGKLRDKYAEVFGGLIRDGVVKDQAELAKLGHVTRARLTQIMNLLCLAPDIQEQILFLPATERGRDAVTERQLRPIAEVPDWRKQRRMWGQKERG